MSYKRRVCVSLRNDEIVWATADEITKEIGFASFVVACILIYKSKNPIFIHLLFKQLKALDKKQKAVKNNG